jgi:hypothetical protein
MSAHAFQIDFTVNNDASRQALQEEMREYKALEQLADMVAKKIGTTRDNEAQKAKQAVKEIMTAEQVAAEAKVRMIDLTNQRAINAAVQQLDASKKQEQAHKSVAAAAQTVFGSIQNIVGTLGGITSLAAGVGYFAAQFRQVQQDAQKAAMDVAGYREKLSELASLNGRPYADADTLRKEMAFRKETFQKGGEATSLQVAARGMAASVIGTKISDADFTEGLKAAGRLQAIKGGDAGTFGQLAGALALYAPGKISGDDLKRQIMTQYKVADLGNMQPGQFNETLTKLAPLVQTGDFKDIATLGGFASGMSLGGKDDVAIRTRQLVRMTRGSLNDITAPPGAEMSPSEYFRGIGANDQMPTDSILEMMARDVEKADALAARNGKKLSMETYLGQRGFGSSEEINAFKSYYNFRPQITGTFIPTARNTMSLKDANKALSVLAASPDGAKRQAELAKDQAAIAMGAGPGEYAEAYRRDLFERLKVRDQGFLAGWKGDFASSQGLIGGAQFQQEMMDDLRAKGVAAGLPWQTKTFGGGGGMGGSYHTEDPLRAILGGAAPGSPAESAGLGKAYQMLMEKGVNPLGSKEFDESMKRQLDISEKMEQHLQKIAEQAQPPVLQGKPGGKGGGNRLP